MNIDDDDRLPDFFEDEDERSIEDLVREDREAAEAEDAILNDGKNSGLTKKIIAGAAGLLVVGGLITATFVFDPFGGSQTVGEKDSKLASQTDETDDVTQDTTKNLSEEEANAIAPLVEGEDQFYLEEGNQFPVTMEDWQKTEYDPATVNDSRGMILYSTNGTGLQKDAATLPFEASGYTSDESKIVLEDGSLNPMYSYWTAEGFIAEAATIQERLLNPAYGGWGVYQYPSYPGNEFYDPAILNDIFTADFLQKNADKKYSDYVPIYADWNGDNYGGMDNLLESGPRWYGETSNDKYEFVYDSNTNTYSVNMTADVKFTAWDKDQNKLEKNGTLTIKFVPNNNNTGNNSAHKVLVDEASLKVD